MEQDKATSKLATISTRAELANLLSIDYKQFCYFLYAKNRKTLYNTFYITKKDGSKRRIDAPGIWLKMVQRRLTKLLYEIFIPKPYVFGFIPSRSYSDGAKHHTRKNYVVNIDLKDFFSQINFGRVRGVFLAKPYSFCNEVATTIAQIACYNNALPQGSPCSPIITNIVCRPFDNYLKKIAVKNRFHYTRYADDLTFSTYKNEIPLNIAQRLDSSYSIGTELIKAIEESGFIVNREKFRVYEKTQRQEVTGLTVNRKVNINKKYMKRIRAILHKCQTIGIYESAKEYNELGLCKRYDIVKLIQNNEKPEIVTRWFIGVLQGKLAFIRQIRGSDDLLFQSLASKFNDLTGKEYFNVDKLNQFNIAIVNNVFLLKPLDNGAQGSCFLLQNRLVTCYHVIKEGTWYEVAMCSNGSETKLGIVNVKTDMKYYDEGLDFAVIDFRDFGNGFQIGDSNCLKVEDVITIAGFPEYMEGDSINIQGCTITSLSKFLNYPLYTISGRIVHGFSGGIVLNNERAIIGIIRAGVHYEADAENTIKQGFIPIHLVINYISNA